MVLKSLIESGHDVLSVISQKATYRRRNKKKDTPITVFAKEKGIKTIHPENLDDEELLDQLRSQKPDFFVIFSYGKILTKKLLIIPEYGSINIHCSLLPKWRGGAPIQRALLNGDNITGVSFFSINEGLDTGNIIKSYEYVIEDTDNTITLQNKLAQLASDKICDVLNSFKKNKESVKQDNSNATFAKKIDKKEANINWNDTSIKIIQKIKAFVEWPKAHAIVEGNDVKILDATISHEESNISPGSVVHFSSDGLSVKTGDSIIVIKKIQIPGRNSTNIRDFFNSNIKLCKILKEIHSK